MKETRIEFRSSPAEKDLFMLAAKLTGVNVSVFLRKAALEAANDAIEKYEKLSLTERDRDRFLKALKSPPPPSKKLKEALKRYKKRQIE